MNDNEPVGKIILYHGPMFSHKSESLIRELMDAKRSGLTVVAFKHRDDSRYGADEICTHSGQRYPAMSASSAKDLAEYLGKWSNRNMLGIDEVQFFDEGILPLFERLREKGKIVVATGLLDTFLNEPFPLAGAHGKTMYDLYAIVDKAVRQYAKCSYRREEGGFCMEEATRTQRLSKDQMPVGPDDPLKCIGDGRYSIDGRVYEARCPRHHFVNLDGRVLPIHKFRELQATPKS